MKSPISLQLYSLSELGLNSLQAYLDNAIAAGFSSVEIAGFAGSPRDEAIEILRQSPLEIVSMHCLWSEIAPAPEEIARTTLEIGTSDVVIAWIPPVLLKTKEACAMLGKRFEVAGRIMKAFGVRLSLHNHADELATVEGKLAIDWILSNASEQFLSWELDTHWVRHADQDLQQTYDGWAHRISMIHLRDNAPFGEGQIDFRNFLLRSHARNATKRLIIEVDPSERNAVSVAQSNREYIEKHLLDKALTD